MKFICRHNIPGDNAPIRTKAVGGVSVVIVALCVFIGACSPPNSDLEIECFKTGESPCFTVHKVTTGADGWPRTTIYSVDSVLSTSQIRGFTPDSSLDDEPVVIVPQDPVFDHPERDTLILVTLVDDLQMPIFPEPDHTKPRDHPYNIEQLEESDRIIADIRKQRKSWEERALDGLDTLRIEVIERFWLINGFLVRTPRKNIPILRKRPEVLFVDPPLLAAPPLDSQFVTILTTEIARSLHRYKTPIGKPVKAGRELIGSDAFFDQKMYRGGWMALLDTGIHFNHIQLTSPTSIYRQGDCIHGGPDCLARNEDYNSAEACGAWPHGTSSAAILTANSNQGDSLRGVTNVSLDSFRIFVCRADSTQPNVYLDYAAAVRGFQAAVRSLDKVVLSEMQGVPQECFVTDGGTRCEIKDGKILWQNHPSLYHGVISHAADRAFDAGVATFSATGNSGVQVAQPASGHKVLGIGTFNVRTLKTDYVSQGRGPLRDGRIKPEIQAPTATITASGLTDVWLNEHAGTSGAAPFAAGAAALYRNWLKSTSEEDSTGWVLRAVEPGQLYAQMILSGQSTHPPSDSAGTGHLKMVPLDSESFWGKVVIDTNAAQIDIPLEITGTGYKKLSAALWWPEDFGYGHEAISLTLLDPENTEAAVSNEVLSVFQKVSISDETISGTWTLRLRAESPADKPRVVYWTAAASFE